ncbi:YcnI family protein [Streptomyces sulphureus]|uniref:YcnI family copper-binding membrane protein n=1 Tax=Streptomyces sulphureus TaxID=47758 RepID=UPI000379E586|nr:YcnI family protein [Streptomyces sulphureus]
MEKNQVRSARRFTVVGAAAVSGVLLCAGPAAAHVSVDPEEAEQGGYAVVNFKVPNERDDASTEKLEVHLPTDHPLASAMPQPVPGWKVEVTKEKLDKPLESHGEKITEAVSKITWTGGEIKPGEFQQFPVSLGQLPKDTNELVFKALQTYDSGEVVRWIEEPEEGAEEPETPAPVLKLAADDAAESGAGSPAKAGETETASAESSADGGADTAARVLGVAGIVLGAAGVGFGVLAGRRGRAGQ